MQLRLPSQSHSQSRITASQSHRRLLQMFCLTDTTSTRFLCICLNCWSLGHSSDSNHSTESTPPQRPRARVYGVWCTSSPPLIRVITPPPLLLSLPNLEKFPMMDSSRWVLVGYGCHHTLSTAQLVASSPRGSNAASPCPPAICGWHAYKITLPLRARLSALFKSAVRARVRPTCKV